MGIPLRVLIVEDSEGDALLICRELERGGYAPQPARVDTRKAMLDALQGGPWDLVIADYVLPHFNGLLALQLLREQSLDLPFILVSGAIGEETAVEAMKTGAHDCVMKSNLARLAPAVTRELREAEGRARRRQAEAELRAEHERLQRRLLFARALNEMAEAVIAREEQAQLLQSLTAIAGRTLRTDRALLFDVDIQAGQAGGLCEWLGAATPDAPSKPAPVTATQAVYSYDLIAPGVQSIWETRRWLESHARNVHPALTAGDRAAALHHRMQVHSLLWYPFFFRPQGFYMLVLNQVAERAWREDELDFLEAAAKQVSLALQKIAIVAQRRRAEEALREGKAHLRKVMDFWDFREGPPHTP